jgi:hypothetical protein
MTMQKIGNADCGPITNKARSKISCYHLPCKASLSVLCSYIRNAWDRILFYTGWYALVSYVLGKCQTFRESDTKMTICNKYNGKKNCVIYSSMYTNYQFFIITVCLKYDKISFTQ